MSDYGPLLTTTGRPRYAGPVQYDVADRPDPDRPDTGRTPPTVRGASRHDAVRTAFGERSAEFLACERFRDDCAMATGARCDGGRASMRVQGGGKSPEPAQRQLDAMQRAHRAWAAFDRDLVVVASACILGAVGLRQFERDYRLRNGSAGRMLRDAVKCLLEHYKAVDSAGTRYV